ncbi:MAG: Ig-like domain-containing protein, partial [Spirochaetes bacterium]|nr:Ig-like domain-containing protein [Spirochaetota bacterium]MBU1079164.1 Ig-like domain-containing protein [Spirochaetota bacterium]
MKPTAARRIGLYLLAIAAALSFSTCDDFFGTEDLKAIIKEDVATASAPSVAVTILPAEKTSMGAPSPIGAQSYKVGLEYTITTTVGDDYTFAGWVCSGAEGDYTFADATKATTEITINRVVEGLTLQPTFDRRPYVVTWTPYSGSTNNLINKTIVVTFNEAISDLSGQIGLDKLIQITTVKTAKITSETPTHIEDRFTASVEGSSLTIGLKSGEFLEIYSTVTVSLASAITDAAGNAMTNDFSWFFETGSGKDTSAPAITAYSVTGNGYVASPAVTFNIAAEDDLSDITQMRIIETPWSTGDASGSMPAGGTVYNSGDIDFLVEKPYTLQSRTTAPSENGWAKIQIQVADTSGNWSSLDTETTMNTLYVCLDTVAPSFSIGLSLSGGNEYSNTQSISIGYAASDSLSGIVGWQVSESSTPGSTWADSAPITYTFANAANETKTVYIFTIDRAGNVSIGSSDSIAFDNIEPTVTITAGPSATAAKSGTVVTYTLSIAGATTYSMDASDIQLNASGATGTVAVAGGDTATPTVTVTTGTGDGTLGITVKAGAA